ncbi:MAG: [protein-PII] uridylyltransferase [Pseudomonadota bacterium]
MQQASLINSTQLSEQLKLAKSPIAILKQAIKAVNQQQSEQFEKGHNIIHLVHDRSKAIDDILILCWNYYQIDQNDVSLVAVGGYGRAELHPYSDVDILILHKDDTLLDQQQSGSSDSSTETSQTDSSILAEKLQQFITLLWDIGLDLGQSVRTIDECVSEASNDITIISNLMESRFITGNEDLFSHLKDEIEPEKIWNTKDFVCAKMQEQTRRHQKFNDTAYNLEPNIKEGPGGLRDIQIIGWIAKRHFKAHTLKELVTYKFITAEEYNQLETGQAFLWKIRFALHTIKKRREDRLLFDYQSVLAEQFGYIDNDEKLAVEQFMEKYYQTVMELERLNEILLQYFHEVILYRDIDNHPVKINKRFIIYKDYISTSNPNVFSFYPFALLEIFLILAENPQIKGVRASTIRQIRNHRYLIDDTFRKDIRCRSLFIEILRQKTGITHQMRRMNRYGVLAEYIPAFKLIVGQMQHDLYHAYTVDEHTLRVLRNVRRLSVDKYTAELPLSSSIFKKLPKPELLYIAALFHDIGKGRGGNHSILGAVDAEHFCQNHDLSNADIRMVSWLVKSHLDMSMTAQRKDLGDPQIIHDFAMQMRDLNHLNYLYLLTVADIRATSPKVWNSWKDSLLIELYNLTKQALGQGLNNPIEQIEKIYQNKEAASKLLLTENFHKQDFIQLWSQLPKDYFLQHNIQEIVWHSGNIIAHKASFETSTKMSEESPPLVSIRNVENKGSTEILVFMENKTHIFTLVTSVLSQMALNVTEASTYRTTNTCILHTYHILDEQEKAIIDSDRQAKIKNKLLDQLSKEEFNISNTEQRLPRLLKQFSLKTEIQFSEDLENNLTIMNVTASNRPFLLSKIGHVLIQHEIHLVNTKISTFGEKVEDIFYITDLENQIITDFEKLKTLELSIIESVDED